MAPYGHQQGLGLGLSQRAAYELLSSQGWARFVSVFMFIIAGFIVFGMVTSLANPPSRMNSLTYESSYQRAEYGRYRTILLIVGSIMALLLIIPAILVGKFSSAVKRYRFSGSMTDVEDALRQQKVYWRFTGIIGIIFLALMAVGFLNNL